jgi:hypothetical protein
MTALLARITIGVGLLAIMATALVVTARGAVAARRPKRYRGRHRAAAESTSQRIAQVRQARTRQAADDDQTHEWLFDLAEDADDDPELDHVALELGRWVHLRDAEMEARAERARWLAERGKRLRPSVYGTPSAVDEWDPAETRERVAA